MSDYSHREAPQPTDLSEHDDIVWPDNDDVQIIRLSDPIDPEAHEAMDRWRESLSEGYDSGGHHPGHPVGPRNPPRNTQWKPGQSGNPKGRPTAPIKLADLSARALNHQVTVTENGEKVERNLMELAIRSVATNTIKTGSPSGLRALGPYANMVSSFGEREESPQETDDRQVDNLTDKERALLREMTADLGDYLEHSEPPEVTPDQEPPSDPERKR